MNAITNPKYRLDKDHPVCFQGRIHYPIIAIRDFYDVKLGDRGGCVEGPDTLSHDGDCWIYEGAYVNTGAVVTEGAAVKDRAVVSHGAMIFGCAVISEDAVVGGGKIGGYAEVKGNAVVLGKPTIIDQAVITDNAIIKGSGYISGNALIKDEAVLIGNCNITGLSMVTGEVRDANLSWEASCSSMNDYFTITNVGPMHEKFIAFKQGNGKGVMIVHAMWTMEIDEFEKDMKSFYRAHENRGKDIIAEYEAILAYTRLKLVKGNEDAYQSS